MIKFDFVISNLFLLLKCLGFADISKDVGWVNIYNKDGRVLMSSGERIRVVVDTLIDTDKQIDVCVDCKKFMEYINYIKGFGKEGKCSLLVDDNVFQITDKNKQSVSNNLYLDYIAETPPKVRAKNFDKLMVINNKTLKEGISFAAKGADASEKYSSQVPSVLIKIKDGTLLAAGTDSVKCCVYTEVVNEQIDSEVIIPSETARAVSNIASLLGKDADVG